MTAPASPPEQTAHPCLGLAADLSADAVAVLAPNASADSAGDAYADADLASDASADLGVSAALAQCASMSPVECWKALARGRLAHWPQPGGGATLQRWRGLAAVAKHDLSLAKLVEGHTDALAILQELGHAATAQSRPLGAVELWATWAAESPGSRVLISPGAQGRVRLNGTKTWCSGAADATHALLTAWLPDGTGPQLVAVSLRQPGVGVSCDAWRAVGMADSASADVQFNDVSAALIGAPGGYLNRPGFWQGGAGIAACWFGGAWALGDFLRAALGHMPAAARTPFRMAALGRVDVALSSVAALLRESATWIDAHPASDASLVALRLRQAAEVAARRVLDEVGRALGATPFCRDARFARTAADLPVFIRQSHAERDDAALGERVLVQQEPPWQP